jgi:hypothetical protein
MLAFNEYFWAGRIGQADIANQLVFGHATPITVLSNSHPVIQYADLAMFDPQGQVYVLPDQTTLSQPNT